MSKTLCADCVHRDEAMEYSHGGPVIVEICLRGHLKFMRVTKCEQCSDYRNENAETN